MQLTRLLQESSETSITLEWQAVADTDLPILSYSVLMNDGVGGNVYTTVATEIPPNVRKHSVSGLQTSLAYKFTV